MAKPYCLCSAQDELYQVPANFVKEIEKHFSIVWIEEFNSNSEVYSDKIVAIFSIHQQPKITKELIDRLPKLKIVAVAAAGYNHIDVQMVRSYGVKVSNAPKVLDETVADLAVALILAAGRNLINGVKLAMSPSTTFFPKNDVAKGVFGTTLGIVGMGGIGYKVAFRAKAFNMKVLYNNRSRRSVKDEEQVGATYFSSLNEMLPLCDYVLVAVNVTPETRKIMGWKQFELMKTSATLLNVSRGVTVDQEALVKALNCGEIHSAALDVTDPEPLPRNHPLLTMNNVIISPHCGSATEMARLAMIGKAVENAVAAVEGTPLPSEVCD
uniref:Glyoxylate reductase/hydroxypyruvate reductase n=1 Tax=Phallusia mammillata TaxID=59560 RepID=A0A6F9DEJ7_9ASCI|nr:glyoxylate reductase/hydroxypyruvate reductase-like [Phallusia mammillata]